MTRRYAFMVAWFRIRREVWQRRLVGTVHSVHDWESYG